MRELEFPFLLPLQSALGLTHHPGDFLSTMVHRSSAPHAGFGAAAAADHASSVSTATFAPLRQLSYASPSTTPPCAVGPPEAIDVHWRTAYSAPTRSCVAQVSPHR
jgi:hypothetical protein